MPGYQFKITLQDVEPVVWRRIVVPCEIDMADLVFAITDSMGWTGIYLPRFHIDKALLMPDYLWKYCDVRILYFNYIRDFLDSELEFEYVVESETELGWMHTITYEGVVEDFDKEVSVCIGGERACPPDECWNAEGYYKWLETAMHEDPEERLYALRKVYFDWEKRSDYKPDVFDCKSVEIRTALPFEVMWKNDPLHDTT